MDLDALQADREPAPNRNLVAPATLTELEGKYTTWRVDTPNANGKITVRIAADGRAFGLVAGACKVQRGTVFLLPGPGGMRLEADAAKATEEKLLALPAHAARDTMEVLFCREKGKIKDADLITLYGLLGKLALDGYPNVRLNFHTLTKDGAHAGGLDRWRIDRAVEKFWVAAKPKKRKNDDTPAERTWRSAANCLYDQSNIPNEFVMWAWFADLVTEPSPVVRLVSPALVWSRTIDFAENTIFQFA